MANQKAPPGSTFLLRDVLDKLGISQRKFQKQVGKSLDWVGRIVRGQYSPSWPNAVLIARTLGVSIGVFHDNDPARLQFFQVADPENLPKPPPLQKTPARKTMSTREKNKPTTKKGGERVK